MVTGYKILILVLAIVYICCFVKIKNRGYIFSPIFSFITGISYFILFPFSILVLVGSFSLNPLSGVTGYWANVDLHDPYYLNAFLIIWCSLFLCGLIILIYPIKSKVIEAKNTFKINRNLFYKLRFILLLSMTILVIDWVDRIIQFGGLHNYLQYNWYLRNELLFNKYGRLYVYFTKISHANIIIFTATSILYTLTYFSKENYQIKKSKLVFLNIIIFHLLIILLSGNRIFFALYLLLVFFGFLAYGYKKQIITSVVFLPILLFIFSAWSYTRSNLSSFSDAFNNYLESITDVENGFVSMLFDISEGANILALFHITSDYGNIYEHLYGSTYFRFLSPILSTRIETFTVIIGEKYMPGTNVSLNSTIMGEMFANFGLLIMFLLPCVAIVFIILSERFNIYSSPIISMIFCVLICWCVRSIFYDNFVLLVISLLLISIELFIYKIFVKISLKNQSQYTSMKRI